jgi:hypothetical protein
MIMIVCDVEGCKESFSLESFSFQDADGSPMPEGWSKIVRVKEIDFHTARKAVRRGIDPDFLLPAQPGQPPSLLNKFMKFESFVMCPKHELPRWKQAEEDSGD